LIGGEGSHVVSFLVTHCGPRTLPVESFACVSCGLVWTALEPSALRDHIERHGREILRQELEEIEHGPYRGLPDTDLAREVADRIAELDALARSGKIGLVGRYRELRGVTWDQAHKDVGGWADLTRGEKLALLGWTPKKKAVVDDLDSPFP
jgi:hypothetical protein